jgi:hypothetical protein
MQYEDLVRIVQAGVRRSVEGVKCVMGARTQEECSLSLRD